MKEIFAGFVCLCVLVLAIVGLNYASYRSTAFYAPRYEAIQRDTALQSRAYTEGTIRELYTIKRQYDQANDTEKATLRATALHEFQIFDKDRLPPDLVAFMVQIGG